MTTLATWLAVVPVAMGQSDSKPWLIANPRDGRLLTPHRIEIIASDLRVPWELRFLPDGRQIFTERNGKVRIIKDGTLLPDPALVLPVENRIKMGLLGLAISPDFERDNLVYLAWNRSREGEGPELRVESYRLEGDKLIDGTPLLENIPAWENHTGCRLVFGPDGKLWITTGDANDPPPSQDLSRLSGKILRVNPDGSIPSDNPFADDQDACGEIWSYGHRNPQGLAFQPGTGRVYASEHGPRDGDELNLIEKGANYGWPVISHSREAPGMRTPLLEITPSVGPGCLHFYERTAFPELRGSLLLACLRGSAVYQISLGAEGRPVSLKRLWHRKWGRIRFITEGPDGSLWLSTSMHDPPEAHGGDSGESGEPNDLIVRIVADPNGSVEDPARREAEDVQAAPTLTEATTEPATLAAVACASCHGPELKGGLQRSLLEGHWKHLKEDGDLARVIRDGLPELGMPPSSPILTDEQIRILSEDLLRRRSSVSPTD